MNKWNKWYDSLPHATKTYLDQQAIWNDNDVLKFVSVAFVVGFLIGWIL